MQRTGTYINIHFVGGISDTATIFRLLGSNVWLCGKRLYMILMLRFTIQVTNPTVAELNAISFATGQAWLQQRLR